MVKFTKNIIWLMFIIVIYVLVVIHAKQSAIGSTGEEDLLTQVLKDGTPGEVANLSITELPQNIIKKALYNLSSNDLAIALSKIYSSNQIASLTNISSPDLAGILSKLSSEDLAIALSYLTDGNLNRLIDRLSQDDLISLLNKHPPNESNIIRQLNLQKNFTTELQNNTLDNYVINILTQVLKDGTPGEVANLSITELPQNIIKKALYNLSSNDLAIALSKIYSSNQIASLTNISSPDLAGILSKLSSEDLAIALSYDRYIIPSGVSFIGSIAERMSPIDLTNILNQRSTNELIRVLDKFKDFDLQIILSNISTENIKVIVSSLSPNAISINTAQALLSLSSMYQMEVIDLIKNGLCPTVGDCISDEGKIKYSYEELLKIIKSAPFTSQDIAFSLKYFPQDEMEPFLDTLPITTRGQVVNILAEGERLRSLPYDVLCPTGDCLPASDYGLPSVDFSLMLKDMLNSATTEEILQIPLSEYSSEDITKALNGLSEDKQKLILSLLPETIQNENSTISK